MKIRLGWLGTVSNNISDDLGLINMFNKATIKEVSTVEAEEWFKTDTFRKVVTHSGDYILFENAESIKICKILPLVVNDSTFIWQEKKFRNGKHLWCQVKMHSYAFCVNVYLGTGDAQIVAYHEGQFVKVKWLRNNPDNADIKCAINDMIDYFKVEALMLQPIAI